MAFVKYVLRSGKFGKYAFLCAVQDREFISRVRLEMGNLNAFNFTLLFSNFVEIISFMKI